MDRADVVVVGAGVIGLTIARALARRGREVLVIESERGIGTGISARNSEVIHAGIYYRPGSLKARFCVEGKEQLYRFCVERGVPHRRCGKLVVAVSPREVERLREIEARARSNGVHDLEFLSQAQMNRLEPEVRGTAGLLSPSTGIVDSHALMLGLQADIESRGGIVACSTKLLSGLVVSEGILLRMSADAGWELVADLVINAAGLEAQAVSRSILGLPSGQIPTRRLAKGSYYVLARPAPFTHLIYPVPESGGLGVHATLDLDGQARFGPDVEWIETPDYTVTEQSGERFYDAVRRYWPGLPDRALAPGYAGIRPKIVGPDEPEGDFVIHGPKQHGGINVIALYGIESPGLTSSFAIARAVSELAQ
jgi:L-2-hydroxyglutarate oxidase LhgO